MGQNYLTFLSQAINDLLSAHSATLQSTGIDIFRGLATILLVWFGIKAALSASQGHGGFHFAKFADLILTIAFGLGMLTYYSTPRRSWTPSRTLSNSSALLQVCSVLMRK